MQTRSRHAELVGALVASVVLYAACSSGTEPAKPTTINVNPPSVTLASINATQTISATVLDQNGSAMTGQKVTWASGAAGVATVDSTGKVKAIANGSTQVTATAGAATKSVPVTVQQVAAQLQAVSGSGQNGTVGQALAHPLVVVATDALGSAVAGASIAFAVTQGNGSVTGSPATTGANGQASVTFTLGTTAGAAHQVTASTAGVATNVTFGATAAAGAAAAISKQAGDGLTVAVNTAVAPKPQVKVTDSFGNAKSGTSVTFAVASGGGGITGAVQTTDAGGLATVGSWTVGGSAGANTLTATVTATAISTTFGATAAVAGGPANVAAFVGDSQRGLVGYATNVRPAVRVTDAGNLPVAGVSVTFGSPTNGGSVNGGTVVTNADGIAQVGSWVLGSAAGANSVTATATGSGIGGNPVTFTATGAAPTYNITLVNIGPALSPQAQAAFDAAKAKWQQIIYDSISTVGPFTVPANQCLNPSPAGPFTTNSVVILMSLDSIDGPNQILGQAGPCLIRSASRLTVLGTMKFDTADVRSLINNNQLDLVILHEMGHVLGVGSLWSDASFGCLQSPSSAGNVMDTYYACTRGRAAFDSIGGTNYTGGNKVPVENCGPTSPSNCGAGTYNVHWREPTFGPELMTGYLNGGQPNPLSVLTVESLGDLGYSVNDAGADAYTHTFTAPAAARGPVLDLGDDVYRGPLSVVDRFGRVVRVLRP